MASWAGQWAVRSIWKGAPRVENSVFPQRTLPNKAACLLRLCPTSSEADPRDDLEARSM